MAEDGNAAYFKTRRPLHPVTRFTGKLKARHRPDAGHRCNELCLSAHHKELSMKTLAILFVAATTLAGCVAVPYDRPPPPRAGYGMGDRDRDGVPNRYDRDRDGDGVPNRVDRAPGDPRRY